jgi:hypothetical protein
MAGDAADGDFINVSLHKGVADAMVAGGL